jgi:hypothetical protein
MAHPRQFDDVAVTVIRVRVTLEQRRELEQVARENRTTISGAMREAVNEYVGDYRENHPLFTNRRTFRPT